MTIALLTPFVAIATAEPAAQPISVQTALLIILGIGLVLAIKSLADLHRRVDTLSAAVRPKTRKAVPAPPTEGSLPPAVLAVITAAVYEAIGADHRIVAINPESQGHTWSLEGRRHIFSTRKVR